MNSPTLRPACRIMLRSVPGPSSVWAGDFSYGNRKNIEVLFRDRHIVFFKSHDIPLNRLFDILDGLFPRLALTDAARQARAFGNKIAYLTWANHYLSHLFTSPVLLERLLDVRLRFLKNRQTVNVKPVPRGVSPIVPGPAQLKRSSCIPVRG